MNRPPIRERFLDCARIAKAIKGGPFMEAWRAFNVSAETLIKRDEEREEEDAWFQAVGSTRFSLDIPGDIRKKFNAEIQRLKGKGMSIAAAHEALFHINRVLYEARMELP